LVAVYATLFGRGTCAEMDPLFDDPATARVLRLHHPHRVLRTQDAPVRLVSTARRQSASETSSTAPPGPKIPALFTKQVDAVPTCRARFRRAPQRNPHR